MQQVLESIGKKARRASAALAVLPADAKTLCLNCMADAIVKHAGEIAEANARDIANARCNGMDEAKIDRLTLTMARIEAMADGLRQVAAQKDPVGKVLSENIRPNGLKITKIAVPFGVIGIIYEARPNVTADAAGICIKAGNAVILRGGKEAFESNTSIARVLNESAAGCGLPDGVVQLIPWTDREAVKLMLKMDRYIDLVIPRGGEGLIRTVVAEATMPVLKHYKGVCHLFVDAQCDMDKAVKIIVNAKCSRPAVCNALETLLIDRSILPEFAPKIAAELLQKGVELRGDAAFCNLVPQALPAVEDDYHAEYLSLILAVKSVDGVDDAVEHINTYGSRHSDGILSTIEENIAYFTKNVDSSTVYVNASTRFTDGGEFGMGAEIGISTDKLHARGPMGTDELTTYKYIVTGDGQVR
ncbi:MAG: glutamate-5-semialdehyde dehydrogenase [Lentisphaerae bacterium]|nr:glutamate-5-semialdehyde dehydrogenase [Lentisphaerota bacterium]